MWDPYLSVFLLSEISSFALPHYMLPALKGQLSIDRNCEQGKTKQTFSSYKLIIISGVRHNDKKLTKAQAHMLSRPYMEQVWQNKNTKRYLVREKCFHNRFMKIHAPLLLQQQETHTSTIDADRFAAC